ncbi:hypothetical protein NQ317_009449 [Molorchus minor]|uniref:Dihydrolipoamide acetyltransferase component of pyruvate dehydrogenase complex n=1 Tax=Molorchus minor TaxID=1323400 RepID=A0ABQ9JWB6_9CUCU|nr:hypothetical protein NQ317_009449 [Molorchus minor]
MAGRYRQIFQIPTLSWLVEKQSLTKIGSICSSNFHVCGYSSARVSYKLSDIGEGIREVVVKEWHVKEGDVVSQFDNICEVQSDKASVTITSRYDGVIKKLHYAIDDIALVGKPLVDIETEEGGETADDEIPHDLAKDIMVEEQVENRDTTIISEQPILCIPSVRRLIKEHNVDPKLIKGTGKNARILKEDVLKFLEKRSEPIGTTTLIGDRVEPIKGFQKAMARTMTESLKVPLFLYSDEISVTRLSELRRSIKSLPELKDVKISLLPFFVKAASNALQRYPILNSSPDENCENVTYHGSHNIGIAMDTKVGLAVPAVKNVEGLGVMEIAKELARLMESGREGTFAPDDLKGGTFSISNIGAMSGTYMKPIPLPPQVAIIALGASQVLPRFDENRNVVAEEILNISISADHRIIDGATVARFAQFLKKQIENPYLLFLNV